MPPFCFPVMSATERRDVTSRLALINRVRSEFREMPGLRLTPAQAVRLFSLRPDICARVLATLERDGVLTCGIDGRFGARAARPMLARGNGWR